MMRVPPHIRRVRPELRVFLQDIRESPEEDGIRLILADWLEDQGDDGDRARAELIRLQCFLPRAGGQARRLRRREAELLAEWADDWLGPLAPMAAAWHFERGLPHVTLRAITCFDQRIEDVSRTEAYAWVEALTLLEATPGTVGQLVNHPLVAGVRELAFQESRVGDNGLELLARAEGLGDLRVLRLGYTQIGGRGLAALRARTSLPRLEVLDLSQNQLRDADLVPLLYTQTPPRWRELHLGHNGLGDGTLTLMARSPLMETLEVLDLRANRQIGPTGVSMLAAGARRLRVLNLSQTGMGRGGAEALASPTLANLEELHLDRCDLRDEAAKALLLSPGLPKLRTLSLGRDLLGDEAVVAIALGPARPWRRLRLAGNYIGPAGAEALADAATLERLEELNLAGNVIGDDGAKSLAWSARLARLRELDVTDNALTADGRAALLRRFGKAAVMA